MRDTPDTERPQNGASLADHVLVQQRVVIGSRQVQDEPIRTLYQFVFTEDDLSDLSVLVQIPKVRELVVELADIESQFGDDYLFQKHNEAHVRPWLDALEATEGAA